MALDHVLLAAGLYFLMLAVGLWWLGIRSFLRRFAGGPSPRWWGPGVVEDYLQAREVSRRLQWTPFRMRFFELFLLLGSGLLLGGALWHYGLVGG
jgi:hypothetical protein